MPFSHGLSFPRQGGAVPPSLSRQRRRPGALLSSCGASGPFRHILNAPVELLLALLYLVSRLIRFPQGDPCFGQQLTRPTVRRRYYPPAMALAPGIEPGLSRLEGRRSRL